MPLTYADMLADGIANYTEEQIREALTEPDPQLDPVTGELLADAR